MTVTAYMCFIFQQNKTMWAEIAFVCDTASEVSAALSCNII
jgi:hypothetical protein